MKRRFKPIADAPTECVKEWRHYFNAPILRKAAEFITMHQYEDFSCTEREAHAIIGQGAAMGRALIRNAPASCSDEWDLNDFSCSCLADSAKRAAYSGRVVLCVHEAALLLLWERRRGPWRFRETNEEALARARQEQEQEKMETERQRRERQRKKEGKVEMDAASTVVAHFKGKIAFINVMKNLSVDCDCTAVAEDPCMKDIGILSSLDPVAIDQACLDLIYAAKDDPGQAHFIERVESRHGVHTIEAAAALGFGSREYELIEI